MMTETDFYGAGQYRGISADLQLGSRGSRVLCIVASTGGLKVKLPDATRCMPGGISFTIANIGVNSFVASDFGGNTIATVAANTAAIVCLLTNTSANGTWVSSIQAVSGGPNNVLKTLGGSVIASAAHECDLSIGTLKLFAGSVIGESGFLCTLSDADLKLFVGSMQATTAHTCAMGVYPAANIVSPTASGAGTGSLASPWTLKQAAAAAVAGDTVYLRGGTYPATSNHIINSSNSTVHSGSSGGGPITYRAYPGEVPTLTGVTTLVNVSYITFRNIIWTSTGASWITTTTGNGSQRNIEFYDCEWHATPGAGAFRGVLISYGRNYRFTRCKVGKWYNGDAINIQDANQILVEDCDFSQSAGVHLIFGFNECSNVVMQRCFFRNPWSRAVSFRTRTSSERVLVEDCAFLDCEWNQVDFHPGDSEGQKGDTEGIRFMSEKSIFRNNVVVGENIGQQYSDGSSAVYSNAFEIHYFEVYQNHSYIRVYNNVLHRNKLNAMAFLYNSDAGVIQAAGHKFLNNSISDSQSYAIRVHNTELPWETWLFEKNRISDSVKTKVIYLAGEATPDKTLAQAQAASSTVFVSNITDNPSFVNEALFDQFDASPTSFSISRLPEFFDAFKETTGASGKGVGKELAIVTANGSSVTTITVDDAWWFMGSTDYYAGDKVYIGSNSPVTITSVTDSTHIVVTPAITVAINDKIYLEKMTKVPDIGLMQYFGMVAGTVNTFAGDMVSATAHAATLRYSVLALGGSAVGTTAHTVTFINNNLFVLTHDAGDFSEYTSTTTGGGDLSVSTPAALNSTAKGLSVLINDVGSIFGQKNFTWTSQYLRIRFYLDPNTITMANNDEFNLIDLTPASQESAYVRLNRSASAYKVYCAQRDDADSYTKTAKYTITDAPHYIEVEFKRAATGSSADGSTKLYIDGSLVETISSQQVFTVTRPSIFRVGAARGIDAGTTGTLYIDEIVVRDTTSVIGA